MGKKQNTKKKSFLRRNLDLLFVFVIFIPMYYGHIFTQPKSPFLPREEPYAPYERHYNYSFHFPFVNSYFLMTPENYQPEKYKYPLVLLLHGASAHMYGGKVLGDPAMRRHFSSFVLIPIAPFGFVWDVPGGGLRPKALPLVMDTLRSVIEDYNIDENRIYISGLSMGAAGTYGALSRYPGVFAAAAPMDGAWDPAFVSEFDSVPMWVFHGEKDSVVSVQSARATVAAMQKGRSNVMYTEFPNRGHGAWIPAYDNPEFWYWLFNQKKVSKP